MWLRVERKSAGKIALVEPLERFISEAKLVLMLLSPFGEQKKNSSFNCTAVDNFQAIKWRKEIQLHVYCHSLPSIFKTSSVSLRLPRRFSALPSVYLRLFMVCGSLVGKTIALNEPFLTREWEEAKGGTYRAVKWHERVKIGFGKCKRGWLSSRDDKLLNHLWLGAEVMPAPFSIFKWDLLWIKKKKSSGLVIQCRLFFRLSRCETVCWQTRLFLVRRSLKKSKTRPETTPTIYITRNSYWRPLNNSHKYSPNKQAISHHLLAIYLTIVCPQLWLQENLSPLEETGEVFVW